MRNFYDPSSAAQLHPDLEWMLLSGQVDESTLLIVLLQEHFTAIDRIFRAAFDDPDTAAEGVQDTFARAVTGRQNYRDEIGVTAWVYSLAYQTCQSMQRRKRRVFGGSERRKPEIASVSAQPYLLAFQRLKAPDRMLLALAFLDGISPADLSSITAKSAEQISNRLTANLNHLRGLAFAYPDPLRGQAPVSMKQEDFQQQIVASLSEEYGRIRFQNAELSELVAILDAGLQAKQQRKRLSLSMREAGWIGVAMLFAFTLWLVSLLSEGAGPLPSVLAWLSSPTASASPTVRITHTPQSTASATLTPTPAFQSEHPLSKNADLNFSKLKPPAIKLFDGTGLNSSGPAALSLALQAWGGWAGDPDHPASVLLPHEGDQIVMMAEMAAYTEKYTGLKALIRLDGDVLSLCRLTEAGFPVIVQRGLTAQDLALASPQALLGTPVAASDEPGWAIGLPETASRTSEYTATRRAGETAHPQEWFASYEIVSGCDKKFSIWRPSPQGMAAYSLDGSSFDRGWWAFGNAYLVIYPPQSEKELMWLLAGGDNEFMRDQSDFYTNLVNAADTTAYRTYSDDNLLDEFYTWHNRGTIFTRLEQYLWASVSFDRAQDLYAAIPAEGRPWRMIWHNPAIYEAYFYQGRYSDVLDLANQTLARADGILLEESYYWRALAWQALGQTEKALGDMQTAIALNPFYTSGLEQLAVISIPTPIH